MTDNIANNESTDNSTPTPPSPPPSSPAVEQGTQGAGGQPPAVVVTDGGEASANPDTPAPTTIPLMTPSAPPSDAGDTGGSEGGADLSGSPVRSSGGGGGTGGVANGGGGEEGPGGVVGGSPNGVSGASGGSKGGSKKRPHPQSKPQSAWMLFIQDRREQVKLDNPDIAVTQQQKIMSEIWKTMSGDEREAYRSRARDDQKRYKAEQADKPVVKKEDFYTPSEGGASAELVCPIGRIGRIIKLDQDVMSVTKEATALIGKAMELFTALVAKESFNVSKAQNRRLLKLQDITDIMHNQDQFYWIKDDFPLPPR